MRPVVAERLARFRQLRYDAENGHAVTRHRATLELIAAGHYLAYSDAMHAARLALSGAHARCSFCDGKPVGNAAAWFDESASPTAPCPRCGETHSVALQQTPKEDR